MRLFKWLVAVWMALAAAAASGSEKVQVTDPYIELHTGPGRGYPIFDVAERGEWVEIELRHTDWYKVRTHDGKVGWVNQSQLRDTLTEGGARAAFRDITLADYLQRRFEFGAAWGHFKSDPMLKAWVSYNFTRALALEATGGQVAGAFSGTNLWHVNLLVEPWTQGRLVPFFGIGAGQLNNFPSPSLVSNSTTHARIADASVGLQYHIGTSFLARIDYTQYLAYIGSTSNQQYRAATVGLGFFF